ncbi:MAG: glycosyl hydrolase [Gorillibacterium sp.]|nr:glycosyl hydrolase [Gorillibacterium sp.]
MVKVNAWVTTADLCKRLERLEVVNKAIEADSSVTDAVVKAIATCTIKVDTEQSYQKMDGFGASFTDGSAFLVHDTLDAEASTKVMSKLFDPAAGIGMSFLRQPMGACDFNAEIYSYNELPAGEEDFELKHFSIEHDRASIIPLLKETLQMNPNVKIMALPWSPPGWMKTSGTMIGGTLREECYAVYADYFVKFIQAYEAEGIPIYAVTPQNEPGYSPTQYPGMIMTAEEQISFIRGHLGPAFHDNGITALIICYDHNWDIIDYSRKVLGDAETARYVSGSAWHCYGGEHEAMSIIGEEFPEMGIWFTEASGGEWIHPQRVAFHDQMRHVVRSTRNGAKSVVWWNIALDEHNGPTVLAKSTCRGLLRITQSTKEIEYNLDYYTMGHISKFVQPGAVRIESSSLRDEVETVAFRNPDGSLVLILSNQTAVEKQVNISCGESSFSVEVPGDSAVTITWQA